MKIIHAGSLFLFLLFFRATIFAQGNVKVIDAAEYGIKPNVDNDVVPLLNALLNKLKDEQQPIRIVFGKGRYHFWPEQSTRMTYFESNTTNNNPKNCAIFLQHRRKLEIDGQGAAFIFHGRIQPLTLDSCEQIVLKNFSIDWDIPLTAQGEVLSAGKDSIRLRINEKESPYKIVKDKLIFTGEGWESGIGSIMEFDRLSGNVVPQTGDAPALGNGWQGYHAIAENGTVVLKYPFTRLPKPGNYLILRHSERDHAGIFIKDSKQVSVEQIDLYHCAGLGILSQYSADLSFRYFQAIPNKSKNRYFSGHDDGLHFSNCRGNILVDDCRFQGLMDDPINIHGTNVRIVEVSDPYTLKCRFMEQQSMGMTWGRPGEKVGFVRNDNLATIGTGEVAAYKRINDTLFEVRLKAPMPPVVQAGYALENLYWTPDAQIRHSFFGGVRARGILVTTPGKVIIENNQFNSSGSAILIAGDANYWYESGAVKDVLIQHNEFLDGCMTSMYQFTEGIISIYPEIPAAGEGKTFYHRNIRIIGNTFHAFDFPVLYAKSVNQLTFANNTIIRSTAFPAFHHRKAGITLNNCAAVKIEHNIFSGDVLGKEIRLEGTDKKELYLNADAYRLAQ
ncbi:right-handed parallel beta-helix repeat-containing protein [Chitinophaga sp. 22321]|uniref:Right-handed parallel beta-helix repeat-containing protein n=1 Tax=Chitinophaga hostae TaxID=2831022 RepID=A0ABS5IZ59_9BACT|nr:right-handed parallel beta-helix repeat-containing protein [Chitinophaga hostae]MBS0028246.1 right-handed parallel beta-helix repeat-containing protein [Chitinophaga hostae]